MRRYRVFREVADLNGRRVFLGYCGSSTGFIRAHLRARRLSSQTPGMFSVERVR
jgi:hypothetical protein